MADEILPARTFHCGECGFDARAMSEDDLVAAIGAYARRYQAPLTRFLRGEDGGEVVRARPAPEVWSALEYAGHVRDVLAFDRERIERVLAEDRPVLHAVGFGSREEERAYHGADPADVAAAIAAESTRLVDLLDALDEDGWRRVGLSSDGTGAERPVRQLAERAAHEGHHHLLDVGRSLRAARAH